MKPSKMLVLAVLMLSATSMFGAGGGCVDSPEGPTLALAALGAAGVFMPFVKRRLAKRGRLQS